MSLSGSIGSYSKNDITSDSKEIENKFSKFFNYEFESESDEENTKYIQKNLNFFNDDFQHARVIENTLNILRRQKNKKEGKKYTKINENDNKEEIENPTEKETCQMKTDEQSMTFYEIKKVINHSWKRSFDHPISQRKIKTQIYRFY